MNRLEEIEAREQLIPEFIEDIEAKEFSIDAMALGALSDDMAALLAVVRELAKDVIEGKGCPLCWTEPMYQTGHTGDWDCPLAALLEEVPE